MSSGIEPGPSTALLRIAFTSFWLSGTGTARGRDVDAVCHCDRDGLPAMPMTQVKGQLRETADRLATAGAAGWNGGAVTELFGYRPGEFDPTSRAGALAFRGEARLPKSVCEYLRGQAQGVRARLFRRLAATSINEDGVARDKTLRAFEVAVPLTLEATIEWIGDRPPRGDWVDLLDAACAATLAFGKSKADGYGRALARLEKRT